MAFASTRIGTTEVIIKPCDLCEADENVNWFCKDCDKRLCEKCREGHLKIDICKYHFMVSILDNTTNLCKDHNKHLSSVCRTCEITVCSECISNSHDKHTVVDIHEFQTELQNRLDDILKEKENEEKNMKRNLDAWDRCRGNLEKLLTERFDTIDERVRDIKLSVDEEGMKLKKSIQQQLYGQKSEAKESIQHIEAKKHEYHGKIETVKQNLLLQSSSTFNDFVRTSVSELKSMKPVSIPVPNNKFIVGGINREHIRAMIGKEGGQFDDSEPTGNVERCVLQTVGTFELEVKNKCHAICPSPDGSFWVGGDGYVQKMNSYFTKVLQSIRTRGKIISYHSCLKIVCLASGDALVVYHSSPHIDRFSTDGKREEFTVVTGIAIGIAVTSRDEIAVYVFDGGIFSSESSIVLFSKGGQKIRELKVEKVYEDFCIDQDDNIIIADITSSCLIRVDRRGTTVKRMNIKKPHLYRMKCDGYGNTLGVTFDEKCIYLYNDLRAVERMLIVESDKDIFDFCIDSHNRLFILLDDNSVIVAKYLD